MNVPQVGVGVAIIRDGEVLLGQRKCEHAQGYWAFPGGHLEPGESFEQCAIREVEEETGIQLTSAKVWTVENTVFHLEKKHYVVVMMVAECPDGEVPSNIEKDKCGGWQWFQWNDLPSPLMQGLAKVVARGLAPFDIALEA